MPRETKGRKGPDAEGRSSIAGQIHQGKNRPPSEQNAIKTGLLLFSLWAKHVGLWQSLRGCTWTIVRKYSGLRSLAKRMMPAVRTIDLNIPGYPHTFHVRWPGSDIHIAHTILSCAEYNELTKLIDRSEQMILLDIGANIGAASAFFLHSFPHARVIAVEPNPANAQMCAGNLRPFGDRAIVKEAALWSRNTTLTFKDETLGTGTEAGVQVKEALSGEVASVRALDVPTLLSEAGVNLGEQPTLVMKIDAEGAEREIFRGPVDWLAHISWIAIELHDYLPGAEGCHDAFFEAVAPYLAKRIDYKDTTFVQLKESAAPAAAPLVL